jgi:hypothetical protein
MPGNTSGVTRRASICGTLATPRPAGVSIQGLMELPCGLAIRCAGKENGSRLGQQRVAAIDRVERCGQPMAAEIAMADRRGHGSIRETAHAEFSVQARKRSLLDLRGRSAGPAFNANPGDGGSSFRPGPGCGRAQEGAWAQCGCER